MSKQVKVKVRPGRTVRFPAICSHCNRPAGEKMRLKKRTGRITRLIDVPLCPECAREIRHQSGDEERLEKIGRLAAGAAAVVVFGLLLLLLPGTLLLVLRLIVALAAAALLGLGILALFQRRSRQAARPEKKAILASVQMTDFSWRAATFDFNNEYFAKRFVDLNEPYLMEN